MLRFIYRHERLAKAYDWLGDNWLMVVIYVLFVAVVLCMINLIVMLHAAHDMRQKFKRRNIQWIYENIQDIPFTADSLCAAIDNSLQQR